MKSDVKQSLERTLESAVILSWSDLMHDAQTGVIHIEYGFAPTSALDYLKVWSSITRGHWLLACQYWMSANTFHSIGIRFENGYGSEALSNILERVMQHQSSFVLPANLGRQGLLQISMPTEEERVAAGEWIRGTLDCLGATLAKLALA